MKQYIKLAQPNGWDFHTGNTINYKKNVGKTVHCSNTDNFARCCTDTVLHASQSLLYALRYSKLPCSVYIVKGEPVDVRYDKSGFKQLRVIKQLNSKNINVAFIKTIIRILHDYKKKLYSEKYKHIIKIVNETIILLNFYLNNKKNYITLKRMANNICSKTRDHEQKTTNPKYIGRLFRILNTIIQNLSWHGTFKHDPGMIANFIEHQSNYDRDSLQSIKLVKHYSDIFLRHMK